MDLPASDAENAMATNDPASAADWKTDERWLLAQRIAASHGFQRAGQIRRILEHITRVTITQPGVALREYEIAVDVLGRRSDFDPANDNIVRQQMSQLRRRLEQYYTEEGANESLRLTIPKGSYAPHFEHVTLPEERTDPTPADTAPRRVQNETVPVDARGVAVSWPLLAGAAALVSLLLVGTWFLRGIYLQRSAPAASTAGTNSFVEFLSRANGRVTVVQPDLSLVILQNLLDLNVTPEQYGQPGYLSDRILAGRPADRRAELFEIEKRRLTTSEEAGVCADLQDSLIARGKVVNVRFARDIRTRDLSDGNLILIGSRRSDPWVMLFTATNNFQFLPNGDTLYHFVNTHPKPGEKTEYYPYERVNGKLSSYVNVMYGPNLTNSGYVLIVNGSDVVANVAAARFLFRGKLNSEITKLLQTPNLYRFELFLRGSHAENEDEEAFELIAVRSSTN